MRTAISTLGLIAAVVLVGACFDPTRSCSSDADCVSGGTCDPGTKTCVSGSNPNDKTPPVFSIVIAPPPPRQNTGKLTELDPGSPDGGVDAFRRDESVVVTVTSADRDVDAGSVQLVVFGVSGNPGTTLELQLGGVRAGQPERVESVLQRGDGLALAVLPFEAFRGVVAIEASGIRPEQQPGEGRRRSERDAVEVEVLRGRADLHDAGDRGRWDDRVRNERWGKRESVRVDAGGSGEVGAGRARADTS